ncbi:MAG: hypothetical protein M5U28_24755 [Sandaracinaceae bacterium]|nr:hypothetical protein [Sandaracinaceae bacterium]
MDLEEEELSGRRRARRWIAILVSLPFLAIMGGGVWFFLDKRQTAHEKTLVEQVTGAAFGCVASMRGDAPEAWSLERALEHMSRMERVTREATEENAAERERFSRLATDAARGCEELGSLMMRSREEAPGLYFAVPAKLAQPPDQSQPERWFRRALPTSRAEAVELARQIRAMQEAINARRGEHQLMPTELPIEGRGPAQLARVIELAPLPRETSEEPRTYAWPLPSGVVVVRRGSIPRVPCDTRHINRTSCYSDFVQTIGWDAEAGAQLALERPASVSYWAAFTAVQDGSLFAVGIDRSDRGVVGRYPPGEARPQIAPIAAVIDAVSTIAEVIGGVAVFASDGTSWVSSGDLAFQPAAEPPPRVGLVPSEGDASGSVTLEGVGTLSIFGSQEDGFTSRLSTATGEVLLRLIDAHRRVEAVGSLSALRSGHAVALVTRTEPSPDAVVLTTDFGRSWVSDGPAEAED